MQWAAPSHFSPQKSTFPNSSRSKKVFNPTHRLTAIDAQRKEGPLTRTGKGHEEGVQLLHAIGREAPPGLIVEPTKDHRVEFEALALVDCHERDLT